MTDRRKRNSITSTNIMNNTIDNIVPQTNITKLKNEETYIVYEALGLKTEFYNKISNIKLNKVI